MSSEAFEKFMRCLEAIIYWVGTKPECVTLARSRFSHAHRHSLQMEDADAQGEGGMECRRRTDDFAD